MVEKMVEKRSVMIKSAAIIKRIGRDLLCVLQIIPFAKIALRMWQNLPINMTIPAQFMNGLFTIFKRVRCRSRTEKQPGRAKRSAAEIVY